MKVDYLGHEPRTFLDYIDLDTGKTLNAVPGGTYDIVPASGRAVEDIPVPWFTPAEPPAAPKASAPAKAVPEPAPEED